MAAREGPERADEAATTYHAGIAQFPIDIVSRFLAMTESEDTPHIYRKWAAISLVGGALERRVWTTVGNQGGLPRRTYSNMYVFLVGAPGVGKFIINDVQELWRQTRNPGTSNKAFHVADSNVTKAAMIDDMLTGTKSFLPPKGPPEEYHCMLIAAEELGVFLTGNDTNFIAVLNSIYNNPPTYSEKRRHGPAKDVTIEKPMLNILGGAQPIWLATVFPKEAWGMGLFSRVIMVYADSGEPADPFLDGLNRPIERQRLLADLGRLSQLYGEIAWTDDAKRALRAWHLAKGPPTPTHSRLEHYCRRRTLHTIKLAIISSIARTHKVGFIEEVDIIRAKEWLIEAEKFMPDIFRSMIGNSDSEVLEELYNHAVSLYGLSRGKPIPEQRLVTFLVRRVPSDKIAKILEMADRASMIVRVGGTDNYVPKNRAEFAE